MVLQRIRWMLHSHSNLTFRRWLMLVSGLGIATTLFIALLGTARANQHRDLLRGAQGAEKSCFDLKEAALTYTYGATAPQWALTITYSHQNGLNPSQAITPTVTVQADNASISLPVISRRDSPTDGQYDLYVDVQHQELFDPSDGNEAMQLAGAVNTLWRQLKHVALDAAMPNDTKPAFSCSCECEDTKVDEVVQIGLKEPMVSPDPGAKPAAAFAQIFNCIRSEPESGRSEQDWRTGYERPEWRIVVVGQVEILKLFRDEGLTAEKLADILFDRYAQIIAPHPTKMLIILFDPTDISDLPFIDSKRLSAIAEAMRRKSSEAQTGKPEILIVDYRDEALVDKLAPPIETVLTVGLPTLFSKTTLNNLRFTVTVPPCAAPVIVEGKDVMTMYDAPHPGDLVDLWQELLLFFLVLVTVVGSWTLLLSTVAYRENWFGIREKLELAFKFPWYEPTSEGSQPSDGASTRAKVN